MYLQPDTLDDALAALGSHPVTILAGGTDYYPSRPPGTPQGSVLDISRLADLRALREEANAWRIGATVTWGALAAASLPPMFRGLQQAAREVGGVQIQNAGTVAGNLCNASPAADGVPPLLALEASVEVRSARALRVVPLGDFLRGSRRTTIGGNELVTAILVPRRPAATHSAFLKLGARRYLLISIVMVAATVEPDEDGRVRSAAIAVGACSAVAQRLTALERRLVGLPLDDLARHVMASDLQVLSPIDDVRASAAYRLDAAETLVRRVLAGIRHG